MALEQQQIRVIKRGEERPRRIRPIVIRKLLLDEKSQLIKRVKQIEKELQTV